MLHEEAQTPRQTFAVVAAQNECDTARWPPRRWWIGRATGVWLAHSVTCAFALGAGAWFACANAWKDAPAPLSIDIRSDFAADPAAGVRLPLIPSVRGPTLDGQKRASTLARADAPKRGEAQSRPQASQASRAIVSCRPVLAGRAARG